VEVEHWHVVRYSKLRLGTFWFRCNGNIPISNSQTPSGTPPSIDRGISPLLSLYFILPRNYQSLVTHRFHQSHACFGIGIRTTLLSSGNILIHVWVSVISTNGWVNPYFLVKQDQWPSNKTIRNRVLIFCSGIKDKLNRFY